MLRNYIKIAWRNIIKQRFYSLLNIAGLSTGIAFTLLIMAYVWSELQVNANLKHASNQYIILSKWKNPDMGYELATCGALPKALKEQYPSLVANYYRFDGVTSTISKGEKHFREGLQLGDSTLLNMYGFKVISGDMHSALNSPDNVVITDNKALKYFGRTDVAGQTLTVESFSGTKRDFTVTAVIEKPAPNSVTDLSGNFDNDFFFPTSAAPFFGRKLDDWNNMYIAGFIELGPGVKPGALEKPIQQLVQQNIPPGITENFHPQLASLQDYYLQANNSLVKRMLFTLSAIAFFILLMAVVNFINMSVSRSASRMKEIGIRKVLGGLRKQLVAQFLAEALILVTVATVIALVLYLAASPLFAGILGKTLPGLTAFPLYFIAAPIALILITGLAAGLYPAFVLSSLGSIDALKGKIATVKDNVLLRKSLLTFQFVTAAIVLIGAFVISRQVQLFFSKDLGYNKDYVVSAQVPRDWSPSGVAHMENVRRQLAALPQVQQVTLSFEVPDGNNSGSFAVYKAGADSTTAVTAYSLYADEYYADTYGIPMAAGQFFSPQGNFRDSSRVVINETQAKAMGWKYPQDAIGQQLKIQNVPNTVLTIAGVVKDFHFGSMQQAVQPITFLHTRFSTIFRFLSFKLKPGNISLAVNALQKEWNTLMPGAAFEYKFMDQTLERLYRSELQLQQASYAATVLSLIIVLLGVMGMVSLSIQKRTKEIGIRKVLGSSTSGIISLFLKEFLTVIIIAGSIACPLGYFIMQQWLNDYVYRISLSAQPFVGALLLLGVITALLIVVQTMKTALANPMKSLRTE